MADENAEYRPAQQAREPGCCCKVWQVAPDDHDYEPLGGRIEREICVWCLVHGSEVVDGE